MKNIIYIFILFCLVSACNVKPQQSDDTLKIQSVSDEKNKATQSSELKELSNLQKQDNENSKPYSAASETVVRQGCFKLDIGDKSFVPKYTFAFDSKPFERGCFVTKYDPKNDEPPTGLEISIYEDGVEVYIFDSRFNPNSLTCSIDEVAFEDLNKDNLQDVIIVGKCVTKSGEVLSNEVFMNTGKGTFYTDVATNDKLEELNNIKEVSDFVKKNKDIFFK